ncbi:unnamed protein product [Discosporangium mesarthrocarpum]
MTSAGSGNGPLMLDLESTELSSDEQQFLQSPAVGGVILFSRNYQSTDQLRDLVAAIRAINPDLLLAVDQEGGRVQRFRDGFTRLPALSRLAEAYDQDPETGARLIHQAAWVMAAELIACGLDLSFAPVLDLFRADSEVIADRAFAAEPDLVAHLARLYIEGMHDAGMCATGKHYPGHGSVVADSHVELPVDDRPAEQILTRDYQVFAELVDVLDAVMPAHVSYPALDAACAGFSDYWLQEKLRQELEFTGVVFSDDLSMSAALAAGSITGRAQAALGAGCDMILVCNDRPAALTLLAWLEREALPGSKRIAALRALPAEDFGNLPDNDYWLEATAALSALETGGRGV